MNVLQLKVFLCGKLTFQKRIFFADQTDVGMFDQFTLLDLWVWCERNINREIQIPEANSIFISLR